MKRKILMELTDKKSNALRVAKFRRDACYEALSDTLAEYDAVAFNAPEAADKARLVNLIAELNKHQLICKEADELVNMLERFVPQAANK